MTVQKYTWKTAKLIQETKDAITIVFDTCGQEFTYLPGQFINLFLEIASEPVSRSYSLSSVPGSNDNPAITIKRVPGGLVSEYLFQQAATINKWRIEGPAGSFTLPVSFSAYTALTFIAGGSGISPLYAMIRYALLHSDLPILLIYTNKNSDETIFFKELNNLASQYVNRFQVQYVFSGAVDDYPDNTTYIKGRLTEVELKRIISSQLAFNINKKLFFLCGPTGLIQMSQDALQASGVPAGNIRLEYYSPPVTEKETSIPQQLLEVQLHFYEQTNLLEIEHGKTILEAALQDHIKVAYSCKNGTCGRCVAKVVEGNVHMHINYSLSEDDLKKGYVLLCQSHPLNDQVTLVIE